MKPTNPYRWIDHALETLHRADWHRAPLTLEGLPSTTVQRAGETLINFASNDYLGLASDPRLQAAAIQAIQTYGTGSTGSRLLSGQRPVHRQLEGAIAALKQVDDALVFSSGYAANIGTIAALVGARDLILADQYNHASLKQGARLSGATVIDYPHCQMADLAAQLQAHRAQHRRCLILTDSVFSMDGDLCPLPDLLDLAEAHDCMVLVDEAHGTGVLGAAGAGCVEHFGCTGRPLVHMGTLSKALGSLGGYVAGSTALIDFLRNRASSWIYTTGLSPADAAAALAAIQVIRAEPQRRARLWQNVTTLKRGIETALSTKQINPTQVKLLPSESPILCLEVKDAATVLALGQRLRQLGLFISAVRPPTVPTSRLRITLMATHQPDQLDQLLAGLVTAFQDMALAQ